MFEIEFTPEAEQDLKWFRKNEQNVILDGIEAQLRYEPTVETRNRKQLRPNKTAEWELRVGKFRVFYDVDDQMHIVSLEAIGLKIGSNVFFRGKEREL
jgi:mRNA-degrading endonuclease RelE of RelBE toxin-antitoxin system